MTAKQFKDDIPRDEQLNLLFRAASTFGVPIIRHVEPEGGRGAARYSVTYPYKGEETTVYSHAFVGEDREFMDTVLRLEGGLIT